MNILYWNVHRNVDINKYIASLADDFDIDILIISEYRGNKVELDAALKERQLLECSTTGCDRIDLWSAYIDVEMGIQDTYYSIQIVKSEIVLCCVHLPSDLHGDYSDERFEIIQQMMIEIQKIENSIQNAKTIIIGDMNEMPYNKGCLSANAMHGLPAIAISDSPTRSVSHIKYRKYYNPMWNFLGDFSDPPGTFYYNNSRLAAPMWYIFDQVIISKDILPFFMKDKLKIITNCSCGNLKDSKGKPNKKISDHFPIMCAIKE